MLSDVVAKYYCLFLALMYTVYNITLYSITVELCLIWINCLLYCLHPMYCCYFLVFSAGYTPLNNISPDLSLRHIFCNECWYLIIRCLQHNPGFVYYNTLIRRQFTITITIMSLLPFWLLYLPLEFWYRIIRHKMCIRDRCTYKPY